MNSHFPSYTPPILVDDWKPQMQSAPRNPDTRPLPEGWAEHFDSQRSLWYYIDLNAPSPRVTFVHPCDGTHPASAPPRPSREHGSYGRLAIRPAGGRDNPTHSATSRDNQRTRRATVAQQLYASSLTLGSRNPPPATLLVDSTSRASSRRPSVSSTHSKGPSDEVVTSSSASTAAATTSAGSGGDSLPVGPVYPPPNSTTPHSHPHHVLASVSSSTPVSPTPASLAHLDSHDPRNYFDCTRLSRGTRRMTYAGPQPGPSSRSGAILGVNGESTKESRQAYTAQAFYHPSVVTSPLASPPAAASSGPSYTQRQPSFPPPATTTQPTTSYGKTTQTWNPPLIHSLTPPVAPTPSHFPDENFYSAVTEDNLMVVPSHNRETSPNHFSDAQSSYAAITEDNLLVMPSRIQNGTATRSKRRSSVPIDVALLQDGQSNGRPLRDISSLVERPILQPKPVKPLKGVSLDLQVQVADNPADSVEPAETHSKTKRKGNVLKGISLGIGKSIGHKGTLLGGPRNRGNTDVSRELDGLASRMDESFVILDASDMRNRS